MILIKLAWMFVRSICGKLFILYISHLDVIAFLKQKYAYGL